jgi:hypothetical protein
MLALFLIRSLNEQGFRSRSSPCLLRVEAGSILGTQAIVSSFSTWGSSASITKKESHQGNMQTKYTRDDGVQGLESDFVTFIHVKCMGSKARVRG